MNSVYAICLAFMVMSTITAYAAPIHRHHNRHHFVVQKVRRTNPNTPRYDDPSKFGGSTALPAE